MPFDPTHPPDSPDDPALAVLAGALEPSPPRGDLRARLMASLGRGGRFGLFADRVARLFDIPLEKAAALLAKVERGDAWRPGWGDGIEMIPVRPGPRFPEGSIGAFGRLKPGARFPKHAHVGDEITLVMAGGFRDSSGVEVERGDELYEPPGSEHDFVVLDGEDCIAAVVCERGVELK